MDQENEKVYKANVIEVLGRTGTGLI